MINSDLIVKIIFTSAKIVLFVYMFWVFLFFTIENLTKLIQLYI